MAYDPDDPYGDALPVPDEAVEAPQQPLSAWDPNEAPPVNYVIGGTGYQPDQSQFEVTSQPPLTAPSGPTPVPSAAPSVAPAPAVAPAAAPAAAGEPEVDANGWAIPKNLPPGYVLDPKKPSPLVPPEPERPKEGQGYGSALVGGLLSGGAHLSEEAAKLAGTVLRKTGGWTQQEWLNSAADFMDHLGDMGPEAVGEAYSITKTSMKDAWNTSQFGPWLVSTIASGVLPAGQMIAMARLNPIVPIAYAAAVGMDREGRREGSTTDSILAAGLENAAMMGGGVAAFKLAEGKEFLKRVVINTAGMMGIGVAGSLTHPAVEAVASGTYKAPTPGQVAEAGVVSGLQGLPAAGMGRGPGKAEPVRGGSTQEKPPVSTTDPAVTAALTPAAEVEVPPGTGMRRPPPAAPGETQPTNPIRERQQIPDYTTPGDFAPGGEPAPGAPVEVPPGTGMRRPASVDPAEAAALDAVSGTTAAPEVEMPRGTGMERRPLTPEPDGLTPVNPLRERQQTPRQPQAPEEFVPGGTPAATEPVEVPAGPGMRRTRPEPVEPPMTVASYVEDYIAGRGRGSREHEQFAANNAAEIEAEFQSRARAQTAQAPQAPAEPAPPARGRRSTVARRPEREGVTVEPDHLDPTRFVAKNAAGEVIGKGQTEAAARRDAVARKGEPYAEQATAKTEPVQPETGATQARQAEATTGSTEPAGKTPLTSAVRVNGKVYTGATHGEAYDQALREIRSRGEEPRDPTGRDLNLFTTPDGRVLTSRQAAALRDAEAAAAAKTEPVAEGTTGSEPAEKPSTRARAKGAKLTPAAAEVLDTAAQKTEAKKPAPKAPKATEPGAAPPAVAALVTRGFQLVKAKLAPKPAETAPTQEAAPARKGESAAQAARRAEMERRLRIKREVAEDIGEAGDVPSSGGRVERGGEDVGERVTKGQVERGMEAPTETRPRADVEAEGARAGGEGTAGASAEPATRARPRTRAEAEGRPVDEDLKSDTMSANISDKAVHAANLLHDHLAHPDKMPIDAAHERYGERPAGSRGAPRKFGTMLDYVRERIKVASDPTALPKLIAEAKGIADDKSLGAAAKKTALNKVGEQIERLSVEQDKIDMMKAARDQLTKRLRDKSAVDRNKWDDNDVLDRVSDTAVRYSQDNRVNQPIRERLATSARDNVTHDAHEYLDDIINNPYALTLTPYLHELAVRLKKIIPRGIQVMSYETVRKRGYDPEQDLRGGDRGFYDEAYDIIGLNQKRHTWGGHIDTFLHELIHGATAKYMRDIAERLLDGRRVSAAERRHYEAMEAIGFEVNRLLEEGILSRNEFMKLEYSTSKIEMTELVAMLNTDPYLHGVLARHEASLELREALTDLGFFPQQKATVWSAFKDLVRSVFGLPPGARSDSVLEWVMRPATEMVSFGAKQRREELRALGKETTGFLNRLEPGDVDGSRALARQARERLTDALPDAEARTRLRDFGDYVDRMRLGDAVEGTGRRVRGAAAMARKAMLPSMSTNGIVDFYKREFPIAAQIRDIRGSMDKATRDIHEKYGDKVQGWIRDLRRAGKDFGDFMNRVTLAEASVGRENFEAYNAHLVNNPTLARRLGVDPVQRARELDAEFHQMPPHLQNLYKDLRQFYLDTAWAERHASFEYAIDMGLGHGPNPITNEQRIELASIARSKPRLDEFIKNPDASPLAKMMGEAWSSNRSMVKEIVKLRRRGWIDGDFFSLQRHGDWIVTTGDPLNKVETNYNVQFFERRSEAEAYQQAMKNAGRDVSPVKLKASTATASEAFRGILPDQMIERFEQAVARRGLTGEARNAATDALNSTLMQYLTQGQGARFDMMKRRGIEGASTDAGRILAQELATHGARMGFLAHGAAESRVYGEAERYVAALGRARVTTGSKTEIEASRARLDALEERFKQGDPAVSAEDMAHERQQHEWLVKPPEGHYQEAARAALDELKARRSPVDGDASTRLMGKWSRGFTTASFVYHLIRPMHMAYQAVDAQANALTYLGGRFGYANAAMALARSMTQVGPAGFSRMMGNAMRATHGALKQSDWHLSTMFEKQLVRAGMSEGSARALIEAANQRGIIDVSQVREIQRMAGGGAFGFGGGTEGHPLFDLGHNMMNLAAVGTHSVDATNRMAILKAAYDLGIRKYGKDNSARAIAEALDLTDRSVPNFSFWNKPRIATERSPLAMGNPFIALPMQYKIYGLNMYSTMAAHVKQAVTRPEERAEALKALAGLFATHSLLIGVTANMFGVPVNAATGLWDWISGADAPHDYEKDMWRWMKTILPEPMYQLATRGVIGMLGADAHRTLRISNMVDVPELRDYSKSSVGAFIATAMTGASGELAGQLVTGFKHMFQGEFHKGVIELAPRVVSDQIKARDLATKGLTDVHGVPIIKPEDITTGTVVTRALGGNPMQTSGAYDKRASLTELQNEVSKARTLALDRYINDRDTSAILRYNATRDIHHGMMITAQDMKNAQARRLNRAKTPQTLGMAMPKRLLPAAREAVAY